METTCHHWLPDDAHAKMVSYLCCNNRHLFWHEATKFHQWQICIIWYGHISTWWSFYTFHWYIGKTCPRCPINWIWWSGYRQWTLVNCIQFRTPLILKFNTFLNSRLSLTTSTTAKVVLSCLRCEIIWIGNVITNPQ